MVNLSRIDKNVYKSLGFKNKTIGQTMIKEVLQTKVTNFKTVPALVQHLKPKISNLINMGFDVNDKKIYKQLKSIKKISKKVDKELEEGNKNVEKIFDQWEEEFNNKIRHVTGNIKVKEIYYHEKKNMFIIQNIQIQQHIKAIKKQRYNNSEKKSLINIISWKQAQIKNILLKKLI